MTSREQIKQDYGPTTWTQRYMNFHLHVKSLSGPSLGLSQLWDRAPFLLLLFGQFWSIQTLRCICSKTNRYATKKLRRVTGGIVNPTCNMDHETYTCGGIGWKLMDVDELKVFFAMSLHRGLKKLLYVRMYWQRSELLLFCHVISQLLSCK